MLSNNPAAPFSHPRTRNPRAGPPREHTPAHLLSMLSAVVPGGSDVEGTRDSLQVPPPLTNPTTTPDIHNHPSTSGPVSHFERGSESTDTTLQLVNPPREVAPLPSTPAPTSVPLEETGTVAIYYQSSSTPTPGASSVQLDRRGIAAAISMTSPKVVCLSPAFSEAFPQPIFGIRKGWVRRHIIDPINRIVHEVFE
jgi:hypothetical protein